MKKIVYLFILFSFLFIVVASNNISENYSADKKIYVESSAVQGKGLFAGETIGAGEVILQDIFYNRKVSKRGKLVNHCSDSFNSSVRQDGESANLVAIGEINKGDEITANYDLVSSAYPFIAQSKSNYKKC